MVEHAQPLGEETQSYWILVAERLSLGLCAIEGSWGQKHTAKIQRQMRSGDKLVTVAEGENRVIGVGEFVGEYYYNETTLWPGGTYPHRIPIQLNILDGPGLDIRDLLPELPSFKRKDKRWASPLMMEACESRLLSLNSFPAAFWQLASH